MTLNARNFGRLRSSNHEQTDAVRFMTLFLTVDHKIREQLQHLECGAGRQIFE